MHLRLQLRLPLIVLIIVDLCLSIPNFVDTNKIEQNSIDGSISLNKYDKLNLNRQPSNVINTSDDDDDIIHKFSKHKSNTIRRNDDAKSSESSMSSSSSLSFDEDDADYDYDTSDEQPLNFLITNFLSDGEIERRIQFNGITAKETLVANSG